MDHPDDFLFMDRSKGKLELWTEDSSPGLDHGLEIEVFLKHKYEMWHPIRGSTSFLVCYSAEPPPPSRFSFQVHRNLLTFPCLCKTHFIRSFSSLDLDRRLRVSLAAEVYLYLVKIDAFNRKGITVKCEIELVDVEKMDEIVPAEDCKDGIQRGAPPAVVERLKREAFVAGVAAGDCVICLEELCEGKRKRVVKMPCSHVFHENCLVSWLEGMNTCPVCRFEIDQANK